MDETTIARFEHPNGCLAQGVIGEDGRVVPLDVGIIELTVPVDREGWSVGCGACGRDLREVTD